MFAEVVFALEPMIVCPCLLTFASRWYFYFKFTLTLCLSDQSTDCLYRSANAYIHWIFCRRGRQATLTFVLHARGAMATIFYNNLTSLFVMRSFRERKEIRHNTRLTIYTYGRWTKRWNSLRNASQISVFSRFPGFSWFPNCPGFQVFLVSGFCGFPWLYGFSR